MHNAVLEIITKLPCYNMFFLFALKNEESHRACGPYEYTMFHDLIKDVILYHRSLLPGTFRQVSLSVPAIFNIKSILILFFAWNCPFDFVDP